MLRLYARLIHWRKRKESVYGESKLLKSSSCSSLYRYDRGVDPALSQVPTTPSLKIGIIGSGNMGSALGTLWVKSGHPVLFSSRHPEELWIPRSDETGLRLKLLC